MYMFHKKHRKEKRLAIATTAALGVLTVVGVIKVVHLMKMKHRKGNMIQDKLEHFQKCFERLIEHR